ncbi:MAG: tetratricopeptide repeat protein [Actinomycetota bacterium]|nr:tetratricopeptide repeat protein [Actinomycetota bacterium]
MTERTPRRGPGPGGGRDPRRARDAARRDQGGRPRSGGHRGEPSAGSSKGYEAIHLEDDIVKELHGTARPGKGEILVKVFSDAVAAFWAGDLAEAIRLGDQSKHMALRAVAVREFLGLAYYHAGRWQDAARELATFRRISGSSAQNPVLADCYRALERPEKAVELCDEIDVRSVGEAVAYEGAIVAAGALADLGRIDDAIGRLEALELSPPTAEEHHLRAWYVLGDLLERRGRFTQARRWFEAVAATDPDATDAVDRAARLGAMGG